MVTIFGNSVFNPLLPQPFFSAQGSSPHHRCKTIPAPCNQIFVNLRNTAVFVVVVFDVVKEVALMEKWQPIVNNNRFSAGFWSLRLIPLYGPGAFRRVLAPSSQKSTAHKRTEGVKRSQATQGRRVTYSESRSRGDK